MLSNVCVARLLKYFFWVAFKNTCVRCGCGPMWNLFEESNNQFSVVHKMWKLGSWQMYKNKKLPLGWQRVLFALNVEE